MAKRKARLAESLVVTKRSPSDGVYNVYHICTEFDDKMGGTRKPEGHRGSRSGVALMLEGRNISFHVEQGCGSRCQPQGNITALGFFSSSLLE
jgi:hypothetical protein